MARGATLGNLGLQPFGGAGVSFGAFDIGGTDRQGRLILDKVEAQWSAGEVDDDTYLAALDAYAKTLAANTSERVNADQRVREMRYRVEREVLVQNVEDGAKSVSDLLAYDQSKLAGLNQNSEEYRNRLGVYNSTQNRLFQDQEETIIESYQDGRMTTAQLQAWYGGQAGAYGDNKDLTDAINKRIRDLDDRLVQERDSKMVSDYQKGKIAPSTFLNYAVAARGRYVQGTTEYDDWSDRIETAQDSASEGRLAYRYDLSQKYMQLAKFVASNSGGGSSGGGVRTSTTKRTVLGADGKWHTVTSTTSKPYAPSAASQGAYKQRQIEVADAKKQMAEIARKISGVGGFVSTATMTKFYKKQLGRFAKGSDEWYAIQSKLDSLNDRAHAEKVLKSEGIRISFPGSGGGGGGSTTKAKASGGGGGGSSATARIATGSSSGGGLADDTPDRKKISVDDFMDAIAEVESGGRYNATNKNSGAYGKYQIMPSNWPAWAQKYLGDAGAAPTPANQEKVAKGKFTDLYKKYGDWRAVAHAWLTGGTTKSNMTPSDWSSSSTKYVDKVMRGLGLGPTAQSSLAKIGGDAGSTSRPGKATPQKPLQIVTGVKAPRTYQYGFTPPEIETKRVNFPKGLDSEAFKHFYTAYRTAYRKGEDGFTIGGTTYFIGDDPVEKRDSMRQLDELRIDLFKNRMHAYKGTPTGISAAHQYQGARSDAAANAIMSLSFEEGQAARSKGIANDPAPLATASHIADDAKANIDQHLALAKQALDRGDINSAWAHTQLAMETRYDANAEMAEAITIINSKIGKILDKYGVGSEVIGTPHPGGKADESMSAVRADLGKLTSFDTDLKESFDKAGTLMSELSSLLAKDEDGHVLVDERSDQGQVTLDPEYHWTLSPTGALKAERNLDGDYSGPGSKWTPKDKKAVTVDYWNGTAVIQAQTKYSVGQVGTMVLANGQVVPVMGKIVTVVDSSGKTRKFVENPFDPNRTWSQADKTSPLKWRAPAGMTVKVDDKGRSVFVFAGTTPTNTPAGQRVAGGTDGFTYSMLLDPETGVYTTTRSKGGGLFSPEVVDEPVDYGYAYDQFTRSGVTRDYTGLTVEQRAMTDISAPWIGTDSKGRQAYFSKTPTVYDGRNPAVVVRPEDVKYIRDRPYLDDARAAEQYAKSVASRWAGASGQQYLTASRPLDTTAPPPELRDSWYLEQRRKNALAPRDPLPGAVPVGKIRSDADAVAARYAAASRQQLTKLPSAATKQAADKRRTASTVTKKPAAKPAAKITTQADAVAARYAAASRQPVTQPKKTVIKPLPVKKAGGLTIR